MNKLLSWGVSVFRIADRVIDEEPGLHKPVSLPAFIEDTFYHGVSRGNWQRLYNEAENQNADAIQIYDELNSALGEHDVWFHVSRRFAAVTRTVRKTFDFCDFELEEICLVYELQGYHGEFDNVGLYYGIDVCSELFGSLVAFGPFQAPDGFKSQVAELNRFGLFDNVRQTEEFTRAYPALAEKHNCEPFEVNEQTRLFGVRKISLTELDKITLTIS